MNIFRTAAFRAIGAALTLPLAALFLSACTVDSTTAVPSDNSGTIYNYAGLYLHPDALTSSNGVLPIVYPYEGSSRPSGTLITSLRILQYGTVLEAFDSANQVWAGSISGIQSGTATFSLNGKTTAGQTVEIAGTMVYSDNSSTMNASWIEPSYFGTLYAQASVPPAVTNSPSPSPTNSTVTLVASSSSIASNETVTLTASGGDGSYTWPSTVSYGSISSSGSSAAYTRTSGTSDNTATITVSSDGDSDSVTLDFE